MTDASSSQQLFDVWKRQMEEGTQAWTRLLGQAPPTPADPMSFWRPLVEQWTQTWARAFAQTPASPDLLGQWKQFVDQSIEVWARALGQAMHTEGFAQLLGRYLEQYLGAFGPARKAAEQSAESALQALGLPSRAQLTGLARQVVELDERVERLEEMVGEVLRRLEPRGAARTAREGT